MRYEGSDYGSSGEEDEEYLGRREAKLAERKRTYYCETCNVQCSGKVTFDSHLEGKSHQKKLKVANKEGGQQQGASKKLDPQAAYHCEICNVDCSGEDVYNMHLSGQKHKRAIKNLLETNRPVPTAHLAEVSAPRIEGNAAAGPNKDNDTNTTKAAQEAKRNNNKRKYSSDREENANFVPLGGAAVPLAPGGPISTTLPEHANDRHVLDKLEQIQLDADQSWFVNGMAHLVETAMPEVAKAIEFERNRFIAFHPPVKIEDAVPLLSKPQRVGLLANNLLLRSDRRADMVMCCSDIPTRALLRKVTELFQRVVRKFETDEGLEQPLHFAFELPASSAFTVSRLDLPVTIFVTLTCTKLRKWSPDELNYQFYTGPMPHDALPIKYSLIALHEIEHTEYYKTMCEPHQSMNATVKIVREFAKRVPAWRLLDYWMIQVMVKNVLHRQQTQLGPSAALKALFKAITDDRILERSDPPKLLDPCDKVPIDVLALLPHAERDQNGHIFASARYALRQINTNNIAKLLALDGGVPKAEPRPKKSRHTSSGQSEQPDEERNNRRAEQGSSSSGNRQSNVAIAGWECCRLPSTFGY